MSAQFSTGSVRRILATILAASLTVFVAPARSAGKSTDNAEHAKKPKKQAAKAPKAKKTGKPAKPHAKTKVAPKPKPEAKPAAKTKQEAKPVAESKVQELDKLCRRDQAWGKLQAVKQRCADLEPRTSAEATYWRLTLSDDPNDLRKGYAPAMLGKGEVDARLLLSAGRYHFARGQTKEMEDLVEIARKKKIAGAEIDTLKHLAAGK